MSSNMRLLKSCLVSRVQTDVLYSVELADCSVFSMPSCIEFCETLWENGAISIKFS